MTLQEAIDSPISYAHVVADYMASHWHVVAATTANWAHSAAFLAYTHTTPATACLALALAMSAFAYGFLRTWTTVALLPASMAAVAMVFLSMGRPLPMTPPAGDYQVLGADIQVDVAIFVLLKSGDMPATYYKLPYSTNQANALQAAMDGEGGAKAAVGEDGGVAYDGEPPVSGNEAKAPEAPAYTIP